MIRKQKKGVPLCAMALCLLASCSSSDGGGGGAPPPPEPEPPTTPVYLWVSDQFSTIGDVERGGSTGPVRLENMNTHYCSEMRARAVGVPASHRAHRIFLAYDTDGNGVMDAGESPLNLEIPDRDSRPLYGAKLGAVPFRMYDRYLDFADLTKMPNLNGAANVYESLSDPSTSIASQSHAPLGLKVSADGRSLVDLTGTDFHDGLCDDNDTSTYDGTPWDSTTQSGYFLYVRETHFRDVTQRVCDSSGNNIFCVSY